MTLHSQLAFLGLSVQAYRFLRGNSSSILLKSAPKTPVNPEEESLSSMAFAATAVALRLWGKLIISILIPTTEHSLVYAKEGWGALEPSLRQSALWFVFETSPMFKFGVFLSILAVFVVWLLERELKRRKVVQRISNRIKAVTDRMNAVKQGVQERYARVKAEVERESRIAAQLLPHILYIISFGVVLLVFPDIMYQFSRGFGAWTIIVGWPVVMSTRRMIQYDEIRRRRLKELNPDDAELSSSEEGSSSNEGDDRSTSTAEGSISDRPNAKKAQVALESMVQRFRKRFLSDASITPPQASYELTSENIGDYDPITEWLRYWSVLSVCLFIEQFPVTGHFLSIIPVWPELRLAFALWLQLPVTRGCDWAFAVVVPLLDKYVKKLPALQMAQNQVNSATMEQRGVIVTVLSALGIVSAKTGKKLLKATEMNGTLIVVSVPFMLSPSFITKIGVLIVGLAFPAHASTACVLELEHLKVNMKKRDHPLEEAAGESQAPHTDAGDQSVFWLEYWVVYVLFSLVHAPLATVFGWWFPLWDQFHLAILLWMQITYFSGSRNIFNIAVIIGRVWRRRQRAAMRRRRRASSVAGPQEKIQTIVESIPFLSPVVRAPSPLVGSDSSVKDEDENTDGDVAGSGGEEEETHPVRDEQSVKLKADSVHDAASVKSSATKSRRASSRAVSDATIAQELGLGEAEEDAKPDGYKAEGDVEDEKRTVSVTDDYVAVDREESTPAAGGED